jgi:hypothetical protein
MKCQSRANKEIITDREVSRSARTSVTLPNVRVVHLEARMARSPTIILTRASSRSLPLARCSLPPLSSSRCSSHAWAKLRCDDLSHEPIGELFIFKSWNKIDGHLTRVIFLVPPTKRRTTSTFSRQERVANTSRWCVYLDT